MLKKIRIIIAAFFMVAVTLLFLDFTGTVHKFIGWCAKIQFVPAILAGNIVIFVVLILITLLIGRLYCSTICPLGTFQDIVLRLASIKKKNRFSYRPPNKVFIALRFSLLGIFALSIVVGISAVMVLLEPYSAYGRIVSQIFSPLYMLGNNILAFFAERINSYAFYTVDVWLKSAGALIVALLTFIGIGIFAWKSGRGYCNTVCPVGSFLAILTKCSLIKLGIDKDKCNNCNVCVKNCKSSCIDLNVKEIDYLRCVSCFNCADGCPTKAVNYIIPRKQKES